MIGMRVAVAMSVVATSRSSPRVTSQPRPTPGAPGAPAAPRLPAASPAVAASTAITVGEAPLPVFEDPARRQKLEAAFPAIDKAIEAEMRSGSRRRPTA